MRMNDTGDAIRAEGLSLSYGANVALDRMDASVPVNGIVGLVGRNGSGKTTFMKVCAGILHPGGGRVSVFGEAPENNLSVLSRVIYAVPDRAYVKSLKLKGVLGQYRLMFPDFDMGFALRLMDYFGLSGKSKYTGLSRGMAATFNFICAMASRSELTMLDEIVLGMDVTVRKDVYEILLRDFNERPRTFVVSSHLFAEVENIMSGVILIDEGKVMLQSDVDEIRRGAYRVSGEPGAVRSFASGREVIFSRDGELGGEAVVREALDESARGAALGMGLAVSGVTPEDYLYYMVGGNREEALSCLWNE
ncbi:MAG: ABC transporter ATP-binding protein [Clostridiales Family XIII bacterium]|jgi:ABC-2 type transport system ATP-binding protein|nr:ABC transporter ATP-binding protein [Clostridiales Family XIII bacterium]